MGCAGSNNIKIKPNSVLLEVSPKQWLRLLDYYAKAASLGELIDNLSSAKQREALPRQFRLTTEGCNNNYRDTVRSMMDLIYVVLKEMANDPPVGDGEELPVTRPDLDSLFSYRKKFRLDGSYIGEEMSFLYTTVCDSLTVIVTKKIYERAGKPIGTECKGVDQWGLYTDGQGGTNRILIKVNSTECGYIPPTPAGVSAGTSCKGFDLWERFHDGNYGFTNELVQTNSADCGYVPPTPAGQKQGQECRGTDLWYQYSDGSGGTKWELYKTNSTECGYAPPPPPPSGGIKVAQECRGKDMWYQYTTTNGGKEWKLEKANSSECGYTPPPVSDTPEFRRVLLQTPPGTQRTNGYIWAVYYDNGNYVLPYMTKTVPYSMAPTVNQPIYVTGLTLQDGTKLTPTTQSIPGKGNIFAFHAMEPFMYQTIIEFTSTINPDYPAPYPWD